MPTEGPYDFGAWDALLKQRLSERTYRHCISTADMMVELADEVGVDREQARSAGLLHDLCKGMGDEELLQAAATHGIEVSEVQRGKPGLLHGPIAAEECRKTLGMQDDAILEAIRWHTTGTPGLGPLGLALYFADFAEPCRIHREAGHARALLAESGFDAALLAVSKWKLAHIRMGKHADPATAAFHAWLESTLQSKAIP